MLWRITNLGDGYCTIQSLATLRGLYYENGSVKLGSMSATVADKYKWSVNIADGGGCLIQPKGYTKYVADSTAYTSSSGSLSMYNMTTIGNLPSPSLIWRLFSVDNYVEPNSTMSLPTLTMDIGDVKAPTISNPNGCSLSKASDFYYLFITGAGCANINSSTGEFTGQAEGSASLQATHKTTGQNYYLSIQVILPTVVVPCVYGRPAESNRVKASPTSILPYIDEYSSKLVGATWHAYENGIITFDAEAMTVTSLGTGMGFAWLEARKNGVTVLVCDIYVDNVVKDFVPDVQDYLCGDGDFLGTISQLMWEAGELPADPLVARIEWFLYAVELHRNGATDTQIINGLEEKFGIYPVNDIEKQWFMTFVLTGANGSLGRDDIVLSFDGLKSMFDFFWFNYAAYAIATLDTVNVYTPATEYDIIVQNNAAKKMCRDARSIICQAQDKQFFSGYHMDDFQPTTLKAGTKVYRLCQDSDNLYQGAWYTTGPNVFNCNFDYNSIYSGLQVDTNTPYHNYKMAEYIITEDITVAGGIVQANTQFGEGGFTQYFIANWSETVSFNGVIYDLTNIP